MRPSTSFATSHGIIKINPILAAKGSTKPTSMRGGFFLAKLSRDQSIDKVVASLNKSADVLYAQPNHVFQTFQATNDPRLDDQFYLDLIQWGKLYTALPEKQKDVIVAVIDSGIDYRHEDLAAAIWVNDVELNGRSGIDDDQNGYIDDIRGWDFTDAPTLPGQGDFLAPDNDPLDESSHGTQVAGVIAAISNNGVGITGIADCRLMVVRAGLSFDQGGTFLQEDDLAAGIIYAVDNGADILNLSWGNFDRAFVIEDAIRYAVERGVIAIAAAGNSGAPPVAYPAALDNVISVAAVETTGLLASFSSYGPLVDLVAPGVNIFSTQLNDTYGPRSGSSFAAPQVAGLAALLLSRQPDLSVDQIRGALVSSTTDLGTPGWDTAFGAGQADASQLAEFLSGTEPSTARITSPQSDDEVTQSVQVLGTASGKDATTYRLSWSQDTDPPSWVSISNGTPSSSISSLWTIPTSVLDEPIILRLEIDVIGKLLPVEYRVRLRANASTPKIVSVFYGPILVADKVEWSVRWVTQNQTTGSLILISENGFTHDTLSTAKQNRYHEIVIPDLNTQQTYEFQIVAEAPSGLRQITAPESLTLIPARIPSIGFGEMATLPDGFLANRVTDFDGNGQREITLMPYIEGEAFSQTQFFELQSDNTFESVYTTTDRFLPWTSGDVNHDGKPDLLGTSVARIQILSGKPFPSSVIFDETGIWGGDLTDATGDGANEIIARSLTDHTIRVYRFADGSFDESALLVDFSPGVGEIGPRFVTADLDGDFKHELLAGDGDGDIWIYESDNGMLSPGFLLEGPDNTDARVIGGGQDLDGDSNLEFVVARATPDEFDALNGWWDLEIYQTTGNNQFAIEWSQRISGVTTPGNGISTGDLDGDGRPEIAVALMPDLYVIRADGPDTYRPIYHTDISLTYRPVISDLDRDGSPELIFNANGSIRVMERNQPEDIAQRPEILQAVSLGPNLVFITWMASPGAVTYRLLRSSNGPTEQTLTDLPALSFTDESVAPGDTLIYRVEALHEDGTVITSGPAEVVARTNPSVTRIEKLDDYHIAVLFTRQMSDSATDPNGYRLHPVGEAPTSAVRDQGSLRIVLTFPSPISDTLTHTLDIFRARDLSGALIDPTFRSVTFTPGATATAKRADFDNNGIVGFGDFLLFAAAFLGRDAEFDLDMDGLVGFSDFLIFASLFGQVA
ncbi:MAG: S8 family serine peptidase [Candidatus Latescibacterota bacterium]|nr:S8 family serine peptidase [Candidatus Latescibacterota bacterium]